jgi:GTP-binding protein
MPKEPGGDPLVIRNVEFIGGMAEKHGWRPDSPLPEIAFAGRSNVGKSSLLNSLVRRKSFARVSRTPGRTREINFFRVNNEFVLVDLPGYGYARISKEKKAEWRPMIESYLRRTTQLRGIVLLLDIRREPSEDDRAMLDFLAEVEVPTIVALTKTDKLSKAVARDRVGEIARALALDTEQVIPFSAQTGEGRVELLGAITTLVGVAP